MNDLLTVGQFMTREVVVAGLHNQFSEIMAYFAKHKISHMPITKDDQLIGIVSASDVFNAVYSKLATGANVSKETLNADFEIAHFMVENPVTVNEDTLISEALIMMKEGAFLALPVTENDKIVGIITGKDLVNVFTKELNPPQHIFTIENPGFGI